MHGLDQVVVALWFLPITLFLVLPLVIASVQGLISALARLMPFAGPKKEYATARVRGANH